MKITTDICKEAIQQKFGITSTIKRTHKSKVDKRLFESGGTTYVVFADDSSILYVGIQEQEQETVQQQVTATTVFTPEFVSKKFKEYWKDCEEDWDDYEDAAAEYSGRVLYVVESDQMYVDCDLVLIIGAETENGRISEVPEFQDELRKIFGDIKGFEAALMENTHGFYLGSFARQFGFEDAESASHALMKLIRKRLDEAGAIWYEGLEA